MAKQTIDFAKLIQEDREQRQQQQWQGRFSSTWSWSRLTRAWPNRRTAATTT